MVKVQTKKVVATKKTIKPKSVAQAKQTGLTSFVTLDSVISQSGDISLPEVSAKRFKYNLNFKVQEKILDEINYKSLNISLPEEPQLSVLSFGGGQDSTTILHLLVENKKFRKKYAPNDLVVIMSDTGNEHPSTYQHVDKMMKYAKKNDIEFVLITPEMNYHSDKWQGLKEFYRRTNTVGSKAFRKTCTDNLKLKPIYRYLEDYIHEKYELDEKGRKKAYYEYSEKHGKILMMVGIAKREEKRIADKDDKNIPKWKKQSVQVSYPLVDMNIDRMVAQTYIKSIGQTIPLPSNCMICPYLSKAELVWLEKFYPSEYNEWVKLEKNKIDKYSDIIEPEKNLGVWGKKRLPEVLEEAKRETVNMTDEELFDYKMSHGHCVMSKY